MRARIVLVVLTILSMSLGSAATAAADAPATELRLTSSFPDLDVPYVVDDAPPMVVGEPSVAVTQPASAFEQQARQSPSAKTIFYPDERVRISPTIGPIALILALDYFGDPLWSCTGTLIGPDTVATAGHCLYAPGVGFASAFAIGPGMDGDQLPFGATSGIQFAVPVGWSDYGYVDYDWGIIKLREPLGLATGWAELGSLTTATLTAPYLEMDTFGYPGDKPAGTQWGTSKTSLISVTDTILTTDLDAYEGQSGSPVFRRSDARLFGILSSENRNGNYAVRVRPDMIDMFASACAQWGCSFSWWIEPAPQGPDPSVAFARTWARTDSPVANGIVSRTWMWGPEILDAGYEPYAQAPGGQRAVAYFDKSRMEVTYPNGDQSSPWYVTNGLLVMELMTGIVQNGDATFEPRTPSRENVAGDQGDPTGVTYWFMGLLSNEPPTAVGATIDRILTPGAASNLYLYSDQLGALGVTGAWYVSETNHTVAAPFWDFMNSSGVIFDGNSTTWAQLFQNPFYATGLPVTEAYWATVKLAGVPTNVLVQCFERRCLTYTPSNPNGWQVEAGNVGQHYYIWRYGRMP